MINVTLTFADISELLTFFKGVQAPVPTLEVSPAPAPKSKKAAPSPAPAEPVAPPPVTAPLEEAPAPAVVPEPAPEPNAEPAPAEVSYADLQKAVLALYAKDRGAAQAIATGMGFASYKVMPAERWAEALANVNAALGA